MQSLVIRLPAKPNYDEYHRKYFGKVLNLEHDGCQLTEQPNFHVKSDVS